jgi:hypothetical protein
MKVVQSAETKTELEKLQQKESQRVSSRPPINFYDQPPNKELSLDDFEVFALKRLKVRFFPSFFPFFGVDPCFFVVVITRRPSNILSPISPALSLSNRSYAKLRSSKRSVESREQH